MSEKNVNDKPVCQLNKNIVIVDNRMGKHEALGESEMMRTSQNRNGNPGEQGTHRCWEVRESEQQGTTCQLEGPKGPWTWSDVLDFGFIIASPSTSILLYFFYHVPVPVWIMQWKKNSVGN